MAALSSGVRPAPIAVRVKLPWSLEPVSDLGASDFARTIAALHAAEAEGAAPRALRDHYASAQHEGRLRKDVDWRIAVKRGQLKAMPEGLPKWWAQWFERRKAQVRAIVEHPFHVIKNLFGYRKVSYRGIAKNAVRAKAQAALANLYIARRRLAGCGLSTSAA